MELKTYFAQDAYGNIMPGATVTVYEAGTATLATGLQDESGSPLANPFTADNSAKVAFYAPDGLYDITVAGNGRTVTIRAQFVSVDGAIVLRGDLAATGGAALVGYGSGTVKEALDSLDFLALTSADLPIDDADLILIHQGAENKTLSIYELLSKIRAVELTGNQTVDGVKTFTASPIVPNPATGTRSQAVATMQKFADEFIASLAANGYQKLPSGLIIQWGVTSSIGADDGTTTLFSVAFPNACMAAVACMKNASTGNDDVFARVISFTQTQITLRSEGTTNGSSSGTRYVQFIAIGW